MNIQQTLKWHTAVFFMLGSLEPWGSAKVCQASCETLMTA